MAGHSLLRRIREPELAAARRLVTDDEQRAAILEHLRAMFTTRVGSALCASDYGVVSVTDIVHSCPDAIEDVLKSIRSTIKTYETRLVNVQVTHIPGDPARDVRIRFEISADMMNNGRKGKVKFQTVIDAARTVHVE
jgi:type VI secretion system lysozyme-like protein